MSQASPLMEIYFNQITQEIHRLHSLVDSLKKKGLDPVAHVEIPIAKNMAERVEGLISVVAPQIKNCGMVSRIQELEEVYGKLDWRVALTIAEEIAHQKYCSFDNKEQAMEMGIRVGIAYVTNGVVASPLEGFTHLKIKQRQDGKEYVALYFSGPIRSAGGTGASVSVIIGDYVKKKMGYDSYDPTELELKRTSIELADYHEKVTNLQYFPTSDEIEFMVKHLHIQVDGDPSEKFDVSNYKDLPRIETNKIRNGVCLVIGEGLCQKAPKLWKQLSKWGKEFDLEHWSFLEEFLDLQKKIKSRGQTLESKEGHAAKIKPDYTFIKDIVAGRPVLTHPLRTGGFRLRYGRARNTGLSSMAIHPATMVVLDDYIGVGTQIKVERPSKGSALSLCDSLEGPLVRLHDGSVLFLDTYEKAKEYASRIVEVLFLGDLLINYGDFINRAHVLVPPGYCEEWWLRELERSLEGKDLKNICEHLGVADDFFPPLFKNFMTPVSFEEAKSISSYLKIPLHPRWTYHWKDITPEQVKRLVGWMRKGALSKTKIVLPLSYGEASDIRDMSPKRILELLGVPHLVVAKEHAVVEKDDAQALLLSLHSLAFDESVYENKNDGLEFVNAIAEVSLRDKSGMFIGARMGRPEKAKLRKLTGSPQTLFPVGKEGGRMRSFQSALEKGYIESDFPLRFCSFCKKENIYPYCIACMKPTIVQDEEHSFSRRRLPFKEYFSHALHLSKLPYAPELIKGVRGTSNEDHTPENFIKGVLRAKHRIYVNKDGTVRYDATELSITHFRPLEIGTAVATLKKLGYEKDIHGKVLERDDQLLELKCQDVILPGCVDSMDEGSDYVMFRVAQFIDDLLEYFYRERRFYNLKKKEDLVGHLVMALAPHISAGTVCRIIGFSNTQGFYASPLLHCAVRRDCDGDEVAFMLLMDAFLNFSRKYLPAHRGATQDAPLVVSSSLIPSEVDDMVFDMDITDKYPLEFYQACLEYKMPWEVRLKQVKDVLGTEQQYEGWGFTHDTSDINKGVVCSAYKRLPSMQEKVFGQIQIAEKLRAVDAVDVARLIIERHFIRDIRGNLRKFSMQEFRCVGCNEKYRRPPLIGTCLKCGGRIIFTIAEGSVVKYLEPSLSLAEKFNLPPYLRLCLDLTKMRIESAFGKEKERQEGLGKWFD